MPDKGSKSAHVMNSESKLGSMYFRLNHNAHRIRHEFKALIIQLKSPTKLTASPDAALCNLFIENRY